MWLMERSDPLVKIAEKAYKLQFGKEAEVGTWKFSTNGVATKGMFDIPTIGFGPGKEEHAHSPHDQINIKDLVDAISFYAALTYSWIED
jgi:acetylornithine deacetylase/succinyl-diaminopimelate desuccinylase-like protein